MDMSLSKLWEIEKGREAWRAAVHGVAKSRLSDWTTITNQCLLSLYSKKHVEFSCDALLAKAALFLEVGITAYNLSFILGFPESSLSPL